MKCYCQSVQEYCKAELKRQASLSKPLRKESLSMINTSRDRNPCYFHLLLAEFNKVTIYLQQQLVGHSSF